MCVTCISFDANLNCFGSEMQSAHKMSPFFFAALSKLAQTLEKFERKVEKSKESLEKAKADAEVTDDKEEILKANLEKLSKEAEEARATKEEREAELKEVEQPSRKLHKEISHIKKEVQRAEKAVKSAKRALQNARDEIAAAAGNRASEARSRIERKERAERKLAEAKDQERATARLVQENLEKWEEVDPKLLQAKEDTHSTETSFNSARHRLGDLKKSDGNKLSIYGQKTVAMCRKIDEAKRRRLFQGSVIGPIGLHVKIKPGEERFAGLAELALGSGNLGSFIVSHDQDRSLLLKFRRELGCSTRECGVLTSVSFYCCFRCMYAVLVSFSILLLFFVHNMAPFLRLSETIFLQNSGPRYGVRPSPSPDVGLVWEVLDIEDNMVFNTLVDFFRIDSIALADSKEVSERALLIRDPNDPNKEAIKQPAKQVHFLPNGDFWKILKGSRQMISNERQLRRTIGVDQSAAIRELENDCRLLKDQVDQKRQAEANLKKEEHHYKKRWNEEKRKREKLLETIAEAESTIEEINDEDDANEDIEADTTAEEEEVKSAEEALEEVKAKYEDKKAAQEEMWPAIEEAKRRLDEVTTRNEKVLEEIEQGENELEEYAQGHSKLQANVEKRQKKLEEMEEMYAKSKASAAEAVSKADELTMKARKQAFDLLEEKKQKEAQEKGEQYEPLEPSDEDLDQIEPEKTRHNFDYYKAKIVQGEKRIEKEKQKRALTESDPEAAFMKYMRAKNDLEEKVHQLESIEATVEDLTVDAKDRRNRWRQFRSHIQKNTGAIFDEILNKKGSSGTLEFDHNDKTLNLAVQKDAENQMSQTNDVKALR
jgi:chromosome segregation ATPase